MGGLEVPGRSVTPAFTERMVLKEPDRIEFQHDPPEGVKENVQEKAWAEDWYDLSAVPEAQGGGTALVTDHLAGPPAPRGRQVRGQGDHAQGHRHHG